jgi:TRAP-type uncharacterized transport system substrate-binding protein
MEHFVARALLAVFVGSVSTWLIAADGPEPGLVISSGVETGGYWNAASRLQSVAEEMHIAVENLSSTGSVENLHKLLDDNSPVNLAFAQADAVQHYLNEHEGESVKLEMLENIGPECVFIVTDTESELHTDEDMQEADNLSLSIPSATSGVAVTLDYMASRIPELADIEVSYGETGVAIDQMGTPEATVDAVMMIHRPKERSPEVDQALANPDRYRFVEVSEDRLTKKLWNGRNIYRSMKLVLPGTTEPLETICVRGLLLANRQKLTLSQRNRLSDLVSYNWMRVYATH